MIVRPARLLRGDLTLPGDKSISHRAAMFAALAVGKTRIDNFSTSVDCSATLECLAGLGVEIEREENVVTMVGVGKHGLKTPDQPLDCGNSGTTMRLMSGVLAGQGFESVLVGDESLQRRPMSRVIEPLTVMGAEIESNNGSAPLTIRGRNPLRGGEHKLAIASAQIKSAILLAGLNSDGETFVVEPVATRDHTERMLRWFGVEVGEMLTAEGKRIGVRGTSILTAKDITVPADISAAAFFMVAAACLNGSEILIRGVGLNSSRTAIIDVLQDLGANISMTNERETNNEPIGDLRIIGGLGEQRLAEISGDVIANLIDELPVIAVLATQLEAGLRVRDAAELRVKESDRIAAVVENLRRMDADVEEFDDGFRVGRSKLRGAVVDSFGDHRIAMAFAIAGLFADGETEIRDADCAAVSFPNFFEVLESVANR